MSAQHEAGADRAVHGGWHALLGAGALAFVAALLIDPASAETDAGAAYRRVGQGLLVALGAALSGVWCLRRPLARDLRTALARWRSAPARIEPVSLLPTLGTGPWPKLLWALAAAWFAAVAIGMATRARWAVELTHENGPLETLTVICYLGAAVLALAAVRPLLTSAQSHAVRRWALLLAAAGCLLIAGEETDWGQTYLEYRTPDTFARINRQGDLSLHNIVPPKELGGRSWANAVLAMGSLLLGGGVALLLRVSGAFRRAVWALHVPLPPALSQFVFFLAACIPEPVGVFERNNVGTELREVSVSFAVLIWMWASWRARAEMSAHVPARDEDPLQAAVSGLSDPHS